MWKILNRVLLHHGSTTISQFCCNKSCFKHSALKRSALKRETQSETSQYYNSLPRRLQHKHSSTFFQSQGKHEEIAALQRPQRCGEAVSTHRSPWLFLSQPWTDDPACIFAGRNGYAKKKKKNLILAALDLYSGTILIYYFVSSS